MPNSIFSLLMFPFAISRYMQKMRESSPTIENMIPLEDAVHLERDKDELRVRTTAERDTSMKPLQIVPIFGKAFVGLGVLTVLYTALETLGPVGLKFYLENIREGNLASLSGADKALACLALAVFPVCTLFSLAVLAIFKTRLRSRISGAVTQMVLEQFSSSRHASRLRGRLHTLLNSDVEAITGVVYLHDLWILPLAILGASAYLFHLLGIAALMGFLVLALSIPLLRFLDTKVAAFYPEIGAVNDRRFGAISEALKAQWSIRLANVEPQVMSGLENLRVEQLGLLRKRGLWTARWIFSYTIIPLAMTLATLLTQGLLGSLSSREEIFSALALFGVLRLHLANLPLSMQSLMVASSALKRLSAFLKDLGGTPAVDDRSTGSEGSQGSGAVSLSNGMISVGEEGSTFSVGPVNLSVTSGEFLLIGGGTGVGKSLVLAALAGEVSLSSGSLDVRGKVCFLPQKPWLFAGTLRENVTMFGAFTDNEVAEALTLVSLTSEFGSLEELLNYQVGEGGQRLSGGQRQRVAMARAILAKPDVLIMDEPVSALDRAVRDEILRKLICGKFTNTTRIVASHDSELRRFADRRLVLKNGELVPDETLIDASLIDETSASVESLEAASTQAKEGAGGSSEVEHADTNFDGRIWKHLWVFLSAMGSRWALAGLGLLLLISELGVVANNLWIAHWADGQVSSHALGLGVFSLVSLFVLIANYVRTTTLMERGVQAGMELYRRLQNSVFRTRIEFFEQNPSDRIMNRFVQDMGELEEEASGNVSYVATLVMQIAVIMITVVIASPVVLVAFVFMAFPYMKNFGDSKKVGVGISCLRPVIRARLLTHVNDLVEGAAVIRSVGKEKVFVNRARASLVQQMSVVVTSSYVNNFLRMKLEGLGVLTLILLGISFAYLPWSPGDELIAVSLSLTGSLSMALAELSSAMIRLGGSVNSVRRVTEMSDLPPEDEVQSGVEHASGNLSWVGFTAGYQGAQRSALQDINLNISERARVCIVGRTGSGKSTLVGSLVRNLQMESGHLYFGKTKSTEISLRRRRRDVLYVSQDPKLLPGTLRMTLDPAEEFSDEQIWMALSTVGLNEHITTLPLGLQQHTSGMNETLSQGQRQLLLLARSCLRSPKVIVLDEATSSLDEISAKRIHATIFLKERTGILIVVTHRLHDASEFDHVLVMDEGRIVEQGSPMIMLASTNANTRALLGLR